MNSIFFLLTVFVLSCAAQNSESGTLLKAIAILTPTANQKVAGFATFITTDTPQVRIELKVSGLEPLTKHAFHIHQFGDLSHPSGTSAGSHFDPFGDAHGCLDSKVRHAGDLSLEKHSEADDSGKIDISFLVDGISLNPRDPTYIIGRSLIIHEKVDDCTSQPVGNSGGRWAQGVIGWASPTPDRLPSEVLATGFDHSQFPIEAISYLTSTTSNLENKISGMVVFRQTSPRERTDVVLFLKGAAPNQKLSFHAHQFANTSDPAGLGAGLHFNPLNVSHACTETSRRHAGDFGNIDADENGEVRFHFRTSAINLLVSSIRNVIGHAIIVHGQQDDCVSQPVGNAGPRVAQGAVGLRNSSVPLIEEIYEKYAANGYEGPKAVASFSGIQAKSQSKNPQYQNDSEYQRHQDKSKDQHLSEKFKEKDVWKAIAVLSPATKQETKGIVTFTKISGGVSVDVKLSGLKPNAVHAWHIHQFGDVSNVNGTAAGLHFNPLNEKHGCLADNEHHVGDLSTAQTLQADANGEVEISFITKTLSMNPRDPEFIIGRGLIIHEKPDDCVSQPVGNAGGRWAQGVIGWTSPSPDRIPTELLNRFRPSDLPIEAISVLIPTGANKISGIAIFQQKATHETEVALFLTGAEPNQKLSWHAHQYANVSDPAGLGAGLHFNPFNLTHACTDNHVRHAGDFGNLEADEKGEVEFHFKTNAINLVTASLRNVVGHGLIIHGQQDDCVSQPVGNAGPRVAQGAIGYRNASIPLPAEIYRQFSSQSEPKNKAVFNQKSALRYAGSLWKTTENLQGCITASRGERGLRFNLCGFAPN